MCEFPTPGVIYIVLFYSNPLSVQKCSMFCAKCSIKEKIENKCVCAVKWLEKMKSESVKGWPNSKKIGNLNRPRKL